MTQPRYAPIRPADEVREAFQPPPPTPWRPHRPGEYRPGERRPSSGLGTPGPDQGYALLLAESFSDRLILEKGEEPKDVLRAATVLATRRAALFGRAPVATDIELGLSLLGCLGQGPQDLVSFRKEIVAGLSHHYREQRRLADLVPDATLRLSPAAIRDQLGSWRELFSLPD
jgi:hypothetical protein